MSGYLDDITGPTAADLAAIEAEWPVIEAELDVLDAEISALVAPSPLDTRRIRRARRHLLATLTGQRNTAALPIGASGEPAYFMPADEPRGGAA